MSWHDLRFFRPSEFYRPDKMKPDFLHMLDNARWYAGIPFVITDDYRDHDDPVGVSDSAHKKGRAVDIRAHTSISRYKIVMGALEAGFKRIGVYDRHVHLDNDRDKPQDVLWVGISK